MMLMISSTMVGCSDLIIMPRQEAMLRLMGEIRIRIAWTMAATAVAIKPESLDVACIAVPCKPFVASPASAWMKAASFNASNGVGMPCRCH